MNELEDWPEEAKGWHLRDTGNHYNGGKEWFGYLDKCVEHPRLTRFRKYVRASRSVEISWRVDAAPCVSIREAVERLKTPPVLTNEELATIQIVTDVPQDLRKIVDFRILLSLGAKDLITTGPPGHYRLTESGAIAKRDTPA